MQEITSLSARDRVGSRRKVLWTMADAGPSEISLNGLLPTNLRESSRRDPSGSTYVSAEAELLEFCKEQDVGFLAFAPLGHGRRPGPLEDPVTSAIAARVRKTPAHVLRAWQCSTARLCLPPRLRPA